MRGRHEGVRTSRCYEYTNPSLTRCYGAQYDAVGNPVRLVDPEGSNEVLYDYDGLDRLTRLTRKDAGGAVVSVEDYAYNALGALRVHAGATVDHQRPKLSGGGVADAAVPATFRGSAVNLDLGGRVTLFDGNAIAWDLQGQARRIDLPLPLSPTHFAFDAMGRRALTIGAPALRGREFYLYEGSDRIASVEPTVEFPNGAAAHFTFLFDGVDHPLRLGAPVIGTEPSPPPPLPPQKLTTTITPAVVAYYELDLAGNVRRLRGRDGADLGGYRYTAFGRTLESTVVRALIPKTTFGADSQPLRWKGMWRFEVNGVELYDARARLWAPELGSFLSVDEYAFHDPSTSLWGWPGQNPSRWSDPSGRTTANAWVGIFTPADRNTVLARSAELYSASGRDWDAGSYASSGLKLWASAGLFYTASVPMQLLAKRRPTSADAAAMACPIEIPGPGVLASDATAGAALSADLAAQRTIASSGRISAPGPLGLGASRTAVFDTNTGTLHVAPPGSVPHLALVDSLGLPLEEGRYVGGFLEVNNQGRVIFNAQSGTFPAAPGDPALDMIRGTGVTVKP